MKLKLVLCLLFTFNVYSIDTDHLKKGIVKINTRNSVFFNSNNAGSFSGSGFIIDKKRRLIATNNHVVSEYPTSVKVIFSNENKVNAKLIHTDIFHDFSILQYEETTKDSDSIELRIGDYFSVKEGDDLLLGGNSEGLGITFKSGIAINTRVSFGDRHSLTLQTSFDRAGGTSGGPVFNLDSQVIAIHYKGTDSQSFELAINYIKDALDSIQQNNKQIPRTDHGMKLDYFSVDDTNTFLNGKNIENLYSQFPSVDGGLIIVEQLAKNGIAHKAGIKTGDIILKIDDNWIGDNLYQLDRLFDISKKVQILVLRNGKIEKININTPSNIDKPISKYVTFGGGTFHEINNNLKLYWANYPPKGVYMSQVSAGSMASEWGTQSSINPSRTGLVITEVNSEPTPDLESFVQAVAKLKANQPFRIKSVDLLAYTPEENQFLYVDSLETYVNAVFEYDREIASWVKVKNIFEASPLN